MTQLHGAAPSMYAVCVTIPRKPVAEKRSIDLFFQPIMDSVLPIRLADNKTLAFSEDEYGIRFVPRKGK